MRFIFAGQCLLPGVLSFLSCSPQCKSIPSSSSWPAQSEWMKFNSSLSGRLLAPSPPGAVCHPHQPTFDKAICSEVSSKWTSSLFHAKLPISIDYNDQTCYPNASFPCSAQGYPLYVVRAENALDVKKGIDFARGNDIRLVIKGTGHDYNGRSQAPNSLSIWTHRLRDLQFYDSFTPKGCSDCESHSAVKISAGLQWRDIQKAAALEDVMVVGGADPDVGIGGYLHGAGHSPISSKFGLAADQALEFEVVTANGDIITVNQCNYEDLFWALRGGGASTFAVLLSVIVKTYATVPLTAFNFAISTSGNSETYWQSNAYFHSQLPDMSDKGFMGYYFNFARSPAEHNPAKRGEMFGLFLLLNGSSSEAEAIFKPLVDYFKQDPFPDKVFVETHSTHYKSFHGWFLTNPAQAVGFEGRLGSRLLGRDALTSNRTELAHALKQSSPSPNALLGHLVAGLGVRNAKIAGGDDAVNPAWRKAYTHIVLPASWPLLDEKAKKFATDQLTHKRVAALRRISPNSGAYVNEADPEEPDWQHAFWGDNYGRLLSIKKKWDPHGVFYCFPCVGAELWQVVNNQLCRK